MKNIVVVGTGWSGSIIARKIAEELDMKVNLVERRPHIAGNMYDEYDEHGFLIQKYGPHHFYTNNYSIYSYVEQYAEFFPHFCKSKNYIDGRYVSMPFNFYTLQELIGREKASEVIPKLREEYKGQERVPVVDLLDSRYAEVREYGKQLFDKAFRPYIAKMWEVPVDKIDRYVLGRRAMVMGYDERMSDHDYQGLPKEGFTKLFENLINHENITLTLNVDALDHIKFSDDHVLYDGEKVDCLVFTGPIDELFKYKYGKLPYRSLIIKNEYYEQDSVLPVEGASYPQADGYVRSTEYRKMMYNTEGLKGSVVSTEYPLAYDKDAEVGNEPYYPVITEESTRLYQQYVELSKQYNNIFLCGRLAEFRYIDMHTCIEHALEYFEDVKNALTK